MAFLKIWIHAVWATKYREPFLQKDIRKILYDHIKENCRNKNIYLDSIGGYTDHVHCLISLKADQSIAQVMQLIKGESAYWINKTDLMTAKFAWQTEYYAISVSESQLKRVRKYINNQEAHHKEKSFQDEYKELLNTMAT